MNNFFFFQYWRYFVKMKKRRNKSKTKKRMKIYKKLNDMLSLHSKNLNKD